MILSILMEPMRLLSEDGQLKSHIKYLWKAWEIGSYQQRGSQQSESILSLKAT